MIFQKNMMSVRQVRQIEAIEAQTAQNAADIEYIAMMTDVELDSDEEMEEMTNE